ncbi:hypothetical protein TeGR_g14716 [Tetraparma gracilis]|uniref:PHD-type domain-containing protein n=1 Tax=Tetraparma gracilis TaxID=2962635 RepID=A0ABQ6MVF2_9STRA|nr:hypothetical protein TeGR_g14716 [Tetraparma gracilis]
MRSQLLSLARRCRGAVLGVLREEDTVRTYTESRRSRQMLEGGSCPSQLLKARVDLARSKVKVREVIKVLDDYILGEGEAPRFDRVRGDGAGSPAPSAGEDSDDSSDISVSDVTCVACRSSDSTDDDDLLMCDGHGCFRAFHQRCVAPEVTAEEMGGWAEDEVWQCPLCECRGNLLHMVNDVYVAGNDGGEAAYMSPRSPRRGGLLWDEPEKVFGGAEEELARAIACEKAGYDEQLCGGKAREPSTPASAAGAEEESDEDSSDESFDEDAPPPSDMSSSGSSAGGAVGAGELGALSDCDSEAAGEKRVTRALRVRESGEDNVDRAVMSDRGALGIVVGHDPAADAFRVVYQSAGDEPVEGTLTRRELQRAIVAHHEHEQDEAVEKAKRKAKGLSITNPANLAGNVEGMGDFDESNIVKGKRRRAAVDYNKLNGDLFGDLTPRAQKKALFEEGGQASSWSPKKAKKKKVKEESEEEEGEGEGEEEEEEEGSGSESGSGDESESDGEEGEEGDEEGDEEEEEEDEEEEEEEEKKEDAKPKAKAKAKAKPSPRRTRNGRG